MSIFSKPKDEHDAKIEKIEEEIRQKKTRIAELRAETSNLNTEEQKVASEHAALKTRLETLRRRQEELRQLKDEETALADQIKQFEEKNAKFLGQLAELRETRDALRRQTTELRQQVSRETSAGQNDQSELDKLQQTLRENQTRKEKILADTATLTREQTELNGAEEKYKNLMGEVALLRQKYEKTKLLVKELENDIDPIAKTILAIWQSLPPDAAVDKKLDLNRRPAPE
jgi:chromosome segregation ATPase